MQIFVVYTYRIKKTNLASRHPQVSPTHGLPVSLDLNNPSFGSFPTDDMIGAAPKQAFVDMTVCINSLMVLHIWLFCKFFVAILTRKQSLCILLCVSRSGEFANCFLQSLQQPIYQQLTFQQLLSRGVIEWSTVIAPA